MLIANDLHMYASLRDPGRSSKRSLLFKVASHATVAGRERPVAVHLPLSRAIGRHGLGG